MVAAAVRVLVLEVLRVLVVALAVLVLMAVAEAAAAAKKTQIPLLLRVPVALTAPARALPLIMAVLARPELLWFLLATQVTLLTTVRLARADQIALTEPPA